MAPLDPFKTGTTHVSFGSAQSADYEREQCSQSQTQGCKGGARPGCAPLWAPRRMYQGSGSSALYRSCMSARTQRQPSSHMCSTARTCESMQMNTEQATLVHTSATLPAQGSCTKCVLRNQYIANAQVCCSTIANGPNSCVRHVLLHRQPCAHRRVSASGHLQAVNGKHQLPLA